MAHSRLAAQSPPNILALYGKSPKEERAVQLMKRLGMLCFLALGIFAGPASGQQDQCQACHGTESGLEQNRAHQLAGITCVDCHGGDPTEKDSKAAKAEGTGYLGVLERQAIPELCGNCHADVRRMNPFGIPRTNSPSTAPLDTARPFSRMATQGSPPVWIVTAAMASSIRASRIAQFTRPRWLRPAALATATRR